MSLRQRGTRHGPIALVVCLGLCACQRPGPPTSGAGRSQGAALVVHNRSRQGICYVNLSPSQAASWGPDRLAGREMIAPGHSRGWYVTPGTWDLRLWSCEQRPLLTRRRVEVGRDGLEVSYPAP